MKKATLFTLMLIIFFMKIYSQDHNNLMEINKTHQKFIKAINTSDYELFSSIHSKDLIRIPGGKKILGYEEYMRKNEQSFNAAKQNNSMRSISLRFTERINNDSIASERGIYKYQKNINQPDEKTSYGKFHVILIKKDNAWKILMDYDSKDGQVIKEADFNEAYDMDDFERFLIK